MTDKKFTDEEIIKRLEQCVKHGNRNYDTDIVLDLINRQKAEIKRLNGELIKALSELSLTRASLNIAKVEAYKEFAKQIKKEIENAYNNNSNVACEHLSKHAECPDYEFIAIIRGKMTALQGLDDFIDNLLKKWLVRKNERYNFSWQANRYR